ncbi:Uncharacterised protein [Chlamydia trachomatis]|nr:Uncharacterised protein [Chlamydia trachomatis]
MRYSKALAVSPKVGRGEQDKDPLNSRDGTGVVGISL